MSHWERNNIMWYVKLFAVIGAMGAVAGIALAASLGLAVKTAAFFMQD